MDKKIMLMDMIKELNKVWEAFYLLEADAEAYLEEVKKEAAEEIRVKLYEIISKHRIKELIPCQEDCLCWDIDNLKSFLEQKYAIGEK